MAVAAALRTRGAVACSPAQLVRPSLFPSPFPSPALFPCPADWPALFPCPADWPALFPCPADCTPSPRIQDGRPCSPAQLTVHLRPGSKMAGPAASCCTVLPCGTSITMPVLATIVNRHSYTALTRPPELCSNGLQAPACPAPHCGAGLGSDLNRDTCVVSYGGTQTHDSEETGGRLRLQV